MSKVRTSKRLDGSILNLKTSGRLDIKGKSSVKRSVSKRSKTTTRRIESGEHKSRFEHVQDVYNSLETGEQIVGIVVYVNQVNAYESLLNDIGLGHVHVIGRLAGETTFARVTFIVSLTASSHIDVNSLIHILSTVNGSVCYNGKTLETRKLNGTVKVRQGWTGRM